MVGGYGLDGLDWSCWRIDRDVVVSLRVAFFLLLGFWVLFCIGCSLMDGYRCIYINRWIARMDSCDIFW